MTNSEVPFSPFAIEYAVLERKPENPQEWRELLRSLDYNVAHSAYAGMNAHFKLRERWSDGDLAPNPEGVGRFRMVSRLVGAKWMHPEEVHATLIALTQALGEWDAARGFHMQKKEPQASNPDPVRKRMARTGEPYEVAKEALRGEEQMK